MLTPHEKGGDHYPFKGRGRTQIARHNLDAFEGGGPGKCHQAFIFLTAFYLQNFILVGPLILYMQESEKDVKL